MKAVILAGGKGSRLKPYTTHFPKPLMPIGEKPILEIVINRLRDYDIKKIIITTGHLGEMIRLFFGNGKKFNVDITYSFEKEPLGTAGPLKLLKNELTEDFIVMNGDVLTDLDFSKMIEFHKLNNNIITIGTAKRKVYVDFGIVGLDDNNHFRSWEEKPTLNYLVSMGIYIMSPQVLNFLPKGDFFNLPDLVQEAYKTNSKVMGYIHEGYWLDIGRPEDYVKACNDYEEK